MRMSSLFFATLREQPAEADGEGHALLVRGGFVRQLAAGSFDYLPLGLRVRRRVEAIAREEMVALGAQEVSLPLVQPAGLWRRTGRLDAIGADLVRLGDRAGRALVLALSHEEAVTELVARVVRSYRQLPLALFQIQTKYRDEPRPRGGLLRLREFTMKDAYSFHADGDDFDRFYAAMLEGYRRIFARLGLDAIVVEADVGMMGGARAHELMVLTEIGEDTLLLCGRCSYRANRQVARAARPPASSEEAAPLEEIATPGATTIAELMELLDVPASRTAKAVFMTAEGAAAASSLLVFAVLRGDTELADTKLATALGDRLAGRRALRPATPAEIRAVGAEPGYGSPVGIRRDGVLVVVDEAATAPNLIAGANRESRHLLNVNYGRDYRADLVADIAAAADGDACPHCGDPMRSRRGVEVGNVFEYGTRYSEDLGAVFIDTNGKERPLLMGSYGIGIDRAVATVAESHADRAGIAWPRAVAPYEVALLSLARSPGDAVAVAAERLYRQLADAGLEVLFDDRDERPGVKFNDADLIGAPVRLVVGERGLERGAVEVVIRESGERSDLPLAEVAGRMIEAVGL